MITLYRKRDYEGLAKFWPAFLAYRAEDIQAVVIKTSLVLETHAPLAHEFFIADLLIRGVVDQEGEWLV